MTITHYLDGSTLVLAIAGRIDTQTSPQLETALNDLLEKANSLVLDFKGVDYLSSAGLRVLLSIQKRMDARGGMKLVNVISAVREVFEITGFIDFLTIE